jgi:hypothetical protein
MPSHVIKVLPWQGDFMRSTEQYAGVLGGLGAGKTFIAAAWFVDRIMSFPRGKHCIAGRDRKQLIRGTVQSFHQELRNRNIAFTFARNDGTTTIRETMCRIELLPAENYLSFRSLEADTIWADEIADWGVSGEKAFVEYLAPRVRPSPEGSATYGSALVPMLRFSTNPPLSTGHWLYDLLTVKGFCAYWNASARDNHMLLEKDPTYVERLERSFSEDLWPILIDGKFGNATKGTVFKFFDRRIHNVVPPEGMPALAWDPNGEPLMWALDFNVGLMCSVVAQMHTQNIVVDRQQLVSAPSRPVQEIRQFRKVAVSGYQEKVIYVLGELRLPDSGAPDVVDAFVEQFGDMAMKNGVAIYGDPSGGARSQALSSKSAARSNWAIILKGLHDAGIKTSFRVMDQAPAILDRVNATNLTLKTKGDVGTIIDRDKAQHLCIDFESVKWREVSKEGAGLLNEVDKSNGNLTHLSEAFGYMAYVEQRLQRGAKIKFKSSMQP